MKNLLLKIVFFLLSPLLFILAWHYTYFYFLFFIAMTPLLLLQNLKIGEKEYFLTVWCSFFIYTTYELLGLYNTGYIVKVTLLLLILSFLMSLPFYFVRLNSNEPKKQYLLFLIIWLIIEILQLHLQVGFPFLLLGNQLSKKIEVIQWYEYTGVLGGTFWIITVNFLVYNFLISKSTKSRISIFIVLVLALIIPISISNYFYYKIENNFTSKVKFLIVSTNLDCHNTKYKMGYKNLASYTNKKILESYDNDIPIILLPESAVAVNYNLTNNPLIDTLIYSINTQKSAIIVGCIQKKLLCRNSFVPDANIDEILNRNFQMFNSMLLIKDNKVQTVQAKNILVPFNEKVPYISSISFFIDLDILRGPFLFTSGTEQNVFEVNDFVNIGSPICYESLFGSFVTNFVTKGANIITVSYNEGWIMDKNISERFMCYCSMRAIENRRSVVRSSNCGFSSYTNEKGKIIQKELPGINLLAEVNTSNIITFYSKYGDISTFIFILFLLTLKKYYYETN